MNRRADVAAGFVVALATLMSAEAAVRMSYDGAVHAIGVESAKRAATDAPAAARWAVDARNQAKRDARRWDLDIVRLREEDRNRRLYGDALGPSYETLRAKHDDAEILASAARTNAARDNAALLTASLAPAIGLGAGLIRYFTGTVRDLLRAWLAGPMTWLAVRTVGAMAGVATASLDHTAQEVAAFGAVFVGMGLGVIVAGRLVPEGPTPDAAHL